MSAIPCNDPAAYVASVLTGRIESGAAESVTWHGRHVLAARADGADVLLSLSDGREHRIEVTQATLAFDIEQVACKYHEVG